MLIFASLGGLAVSASPTPSHAELKDVQVARLIQLRSECVLVTLHRRERSDGSWSYTGTCSNETFYPDGILVDCPDPESNDERACIIRTQAKRFEALELLRPPRETANDVRR